MSGKNKTADAKQESKQPSHSEQFRSNVKSGVHKAIDTYKSIPQAATPPGWKGTAVKTGISVATAGKDFGKAGYHGMSAMGERMNTLGNPSGDLQNANIQRNIAQGSKQARESTANKGIEAARQKAAEKQSGTNSGQSTNKGIASFQSKASGQSSGTSSGKSEGSSSGSSKGQSR